MTNEQKHIKLLQAENTEQWDEILKLRAECDQHEEIVSIYMGKVERLKAEIKKLKELVDV